MIIVKLIGGLGNQMFQYAAARRLARVHGSELKIDLSWFGNIAAGDTGRKYEIGAFRIREEFASSEECARFREKRFFKFVPFLRKRHIREKHYQFDPSILQLPDGVYLEGYWQSPRYFSDIRDILEEEFSVKSAPDPKSAQLMDALLGSDSVSVHVRRGDYVANAAANSYHGLCSPEYYDRAAGILSGRIKNPHFFIFSDDPAWAGENLRLSPKTVIDWNGPDRGYEDLRLLRSCRHHIIANSSFSWWGAWLCSHPDKLVIAPRRWFRNDAIDTQDLIPKDWMRI